MSGSGLPLAGLAADINARIAAGDRDLKRAEDHYKAAGIHLLEARDRCKAEKITWAIWVKDNLSIGLRRSYDLLAIGEGKKTAAELKEANAENQQKVRARRAVRTAQPDSPSPSQLVRDTLNAEWRKLGASLTDDQIEEAINLIKEKFRG